MPQYKKYNFIPSRQVTTSVPISNNILPNGSPSGIVYCLTSLELANPKADALAVNHSWIFKKVYTCV